MPHVVFQFTAGEYRHLHDSIFIPEFNQVLFLEDGKVTVSNHEQLMKNSPDYQDLYHRQTEGGDLDAAH